MSEASRCGPADTGRVRVRIGELSARTGVSQRSLRYYEAQGLLTSDRAPSGQRHYGEQQVERVFFIQTLLSAGLSSRTIAELLPCVDTPSTLNVVEAERTMERERERLTATIERLVQARDTLDALLEANRAHQAGLVAEPA